MFASHRRWVGGQAVRRERMIGPWLPKIEEWVERSKAKIRADVAYKNLRRLGFSGSERTVRQAVTEVKASYRARRRRVYRPWIPVPGMWALGHTAIYGRLAGCDLAAILASRPVQSRNRAGEEHSLQGGTRALEGFGQ